MYVSYYLIYPYITLYSISCTISYCIMTYHARQCCTIFYCMVLCLYIMTCCKPRRVMLVATHQALSSLYVAPFLRQHQEIHHRLVGERYPMANELH